MNALITVLADLIREGTEAENDATRARLIHDHGHDAADEIWTEAINLVIDQDSARIDNGYRDD